MPVPKKPVTRPNPEDVPLMGFMTLWLIAFLGVVLVLYTIVTLSPHNVNDPRNPQVKPQQDRGVYDRGIGHGPATRPIN
jgi:hypothetical protein